GHREGEEGQAEGCGCLVSAGGVVGGENRGGPLAPAARGEMGKRGRRRPRTAVMIDEGAEGARPHIVAADETQPIEPLLVAEPHALTLFRHTAPPGGSSSA